MDPPLFHLPIWTGVQVSDCSAIQFTFRQMVRLELMTLSAGLTSMTLAPCIPFFDPNPQSSSPPSVTIFTKTHSFSSKFKAPKHSFKS